MASRVPAQQSTRKRVGMSSSAYWRQDANVMATSSTVSQGCITSVVVRRTGSHQVEPHLLPTLLPTGGNERVAEANGALDSRWKGRVGQDMTIT